MEADTISKIIHDVIKNPVEFEIRQISEVQDYINKLFQNQYGISEIVSKKVIEKHLHDFLKTLKDDLYVVIESPYVDKIYRDTYYNYYSSKLNTYPRNCIRLSFFSEKIEDNHFRNIQEDNFSKKSKFIEEHYLGFLILRPTFPKIIGRNAISPKAKKESEIVCCLARINATINSIKQKVLSFPHASQDNQTMTCAETTIWSLLEYFGNKYPEYKPVLLSQINNIIHKFSYKRLLPSDGLTAEQITYTIRELGFGAMIYSKEKQSRSLFPLKYIISTYIESGIPIIGVLKSTEIGHAVNIVGREKLDNNTIANSEANVSLENGLNIIDFNKIDKKYVFIDDNHAPFQIAKLERPCEDYYEASRWHACEITNIVVPLYNKIYLDASRASKNFYKAIENSQIGIKDGEVRVVRIYLASSRSYKQYIAVNKNLNLLLKEFILALAMPKFIWVAEVSKRKSFMNGMCDELYIQDATEPVEYSDKSMLSNLSLLAGYSNGTFFVQNFGKFEGFATFANPFETYIDNLK